MNTTDEPLDQLLRGRKASRRAVSTAIVKDDIQPSTLRMLVRTDTSKRNIWNISTQLLSVSIVCLAYRGDRSQPPGPQLRPRCRRSPAPPESPTLPSADRPRWSSRGKRRPRRTRPREWIPPACSRPGGRSVIRTCVEDLFMKANPVRGPKENMKTCQPL